MVNIKLDSLVVKGTEKSVQCYKEIDNKYLVPCRYGQKKREYAIYPYNQCPIPFRNTVQEQLYKEILSKDKGNACTPIMCHLPTGIGKTYLSLRFVMEKRLPVLIFYNRVGIMDGWTKSIMDMFGFMPEYATKDGPGKHAICLCSTQLASRHKWTIDDFSWYGIVICDEVHTMCTQSSVDFMLELKPKYLIGLTATPTKTDGLEKVINVFWGPRSEWIYRAIKYDNSSSFNLYLVHTGIELEDKYHNTYGKKRRMDWMGMCNTLASSERRNLLIRNIILSRRDDKILVACKGKAHVECIYNMLKNIGVDVTTYYSKNTGYIDASVVIITVSKGGTGNDDKNMATQWDGRRFNTLIMCNTCKNSDQLVGRLRSDHKSIYLLVDVNGTCMSHAESMKSVVHARGGKTEEIYAL